MAPYSSPIVNVSSLPLISFGFLFVCLDFLFVCLFFYIDRMRGTIAGDRVNGNINGNSKRRETMTFAETVGKHLRRLEKKRIKAEAAAAVAAAAALATGINTEMEQDRAGEAESGSLVHPVGWIGT